MRRLLRESVRASRQLHIRQLPGDLIADLGCQFFDVHKRTRRRQFLLLARRQSCNEPENLPSHSIIHDQTSRTFPK